MDLPILQKMAFELNELLTGAFITKVHQPLPREIVLRIRSKTSGEKKLVLSADPRLGRIHLTDLKIPNPPSPPRFCAFLRAHVQGSRIVGVKCAADDRVVTIETSRGPEDARLSRRLILELLGRDSNILVVDGASNLIMECLHRIPEQEQRTRIVLPGRPYSSPPRRPGRIVPPAPGEIPAKVQAGISRGNGAKSRLVLNADPLLDECFSTVNEASDAFYSPALRGDMLEALRRNVAAPMKSRLRSLERRLSKIQADEQRLQRFAERSEEAELLKANLHRIKRGMEQIEVQDWSTGESRFIKLNPALNGVENMERLFAGAAKSRRGAGIVQQRMQETQSEIAAIQDMLFFLEQAESADELENTALKAVPDAQAKPYKAPRSEETHRDKDSALFHEFRSPSGGMILVGKSAKGNDFLLRRKAKRGDLWFHVKDIPGAHVLLPLAGGQSASQEDIVKAAGLAIHFSRARSAGRAEVIVADVKDLDRPKGALPGKVTVRRYSTVFVEGVDPNLPGWK